MSYLPLTGMPNAVTVSSVVLKLNNLGAIVAAADDDYDVDPEIEATIRAACRRNMLAMLRQQASGGDVSFGGVQ